MLCYEHHLRSAMHSVVLAVQAVGLAKLQDVEIRAPALQLGYQTVAGIAELLVPTFAGDCADWNLVDDRGARVALHYAHRNLHHECLADDCCPVVHLVLCLAWSCQSS